MIINDLDLGVHPTWLLPFQTQKGQIARLSVSSVKVRGQKELFYGEVAQMPERAETIYVTASQAIGPYAAGTQNATLALVDQLLELVGNHDINHPCYIQWASGGGVITVDQQDGWYYILDAEPDKEFVFSAILPVKMSFRKTSAGGARRIGIWHSGGALVSTYSGVAQNWLFVPLNASTISGANITRSGGEGTVRGLNGTSLIDPWFFNLAPTISDNFKNGCRAYDAMAGIGTNPVPTNGTFINSNWIEVKGTDHRFIGDTVLTNGLFLITLSTGVSPGVQLYLWNSALATPAWQNFAGFFYQDNTPTGGTLQQITLLRVGLEEVVFHLISATPVGNLGQLILRLQRGASLVRVDFRPLSQSNTTNLALFLSFAVSQKIVYNSGGVLDSILNLNSIPSTATTSDYGYAATFAANVAYPLLAGFLYQNAPATGQPFQSGASNQIGFGDTSGPAQNATRTYGIFATPFGNSTDNTNRLQAEAESGTLGTGWSSVADSGASTGNAAQCVSGTVATNADLFGTSWIPPPGTYDCWFRVRVTSAAGSAAEMTLGLWDVTSITYVPGAAITYRANQAPTAYGSTSWLRVAAAVVPTAGHNMRFRAVTAATLGTTWFIDEAVLLPTTSNTTFSSPQDHWQQFIYDRTTEIVAD